MLYDGGSPEKIVMSNLNNRGTKKLKKHLYIYK